MRDRRKSYDEGIPAEEPSARVRISAIAHYMREVNAIPVLSHRETMALFRDLARLQEHLDRLDEGSNGDEDVRTRSDLEDRIAKIKANLVRANLRLVVYFANRYQGSGIEFEDLVQEGNIGLMRAIEKFDYRKGHRLSTYAAWWIRQKMLRAVYRQSHTIPVPAHMLTKVKKHLSSRTAVDSDGGDGTEAYAGVAPELADVMGIMREPLPLDDARNQEDGIPLLEMLSSTEGVSPEDRTLRRDLCVKLREALTHLSPREHMILRLRFGINFPRAHTLSEAGEVFQLTKERVRQIQCRAIKRLAENAFEG